MKTLIIEDEKAAVRNLKVLIAEVAPEIEIVSVLDSIQDSIEWFRHNPLPELVFLDIHLADGSAFEIFEHVDIRCPVIFTTAYDEYALRAFKVNSVDYLLKPIDRSDIQKALQKLKQLRETDDAAPLHSGNDYRAIIKALKQEENYKTHFLIPSKGSKLLPLSVDSILFFYIHEGNVKARLANGNEHLFPQTLDEVGECLDPARFFRANRQYLISRKAIKDIELWFHGRLAVNLIVPLSERILISKAKVPEFKEWISYSGQAGM